MRYLVSGREMKEYDRTTIEAFRVPALVLMERAALAVAEEVLAVTDPASRVLVVCGTGNNGADGLAVVRLLRQHGRAADAVLYGNRQKMTEQCQRQLEILEAYGYPVLEEIPSDRAYQTVVDAVFGVGLCRKVEGAYADLIDRMNGMDARKIAVDVPSGVDADKGEVLGTAFRADMTVTFAFEKAGLYLWPGNEYAGEVKRKEIGITKESFGEQEPAVRILEETDLDQLPVRRSHSNKGTYGKLLVIAGSWNMAGAAVLSASAACASGSGLVRVYTPEENRLIVQIKVPEAILTTYDASNWNKAELLEAISWSDAVLCGSGLGKSTVARQIVETVLSDTTKPLILDADALNILSETEAMTGKLRKGVIITPHLGEMSRLTGHTVAEIQGNLLSEAQTFATQHHCICVLKDEHTVTCGTHIYFNMSGNNGMATAGSGDVLAGVISSFYAQGMDPEKAAAYGVFLHGLAGDCVKKKTGYRGMTASDLLAGIRDVFAERQL